jgi:hypothetical protein
MKRTCSASFSLTSRRFLLEVVAERRWATHAPAFPLGSRDLVADALARDLALELGEGEEYVEGEASHTGRGVESLRHRDEGDAMRIEQLDELGEIS